MADQFNDIARLREAYEASLDEADERRSEYHEAIRNLYIAGSSLSEIAENLGISRQRVHEIIGKDASVRRRKRRRALGSAGILIVIAIAGFGVWVATTRTSAAATPFTPQPACQQPCRGYKYAAVFESRNGQLLAIVAHNEKQVNGVTISGSAGVTRAAPKVNSSLVTITFMRDYMHVGPQRRSPPSLPGVSYLDVSHDPHLRSVIRGNLADFRIKNGRLTNTNRHRWAFVAVGGVLAAGIVGLAVFNRRMSKRVLVPVAPAL